MKNIFKRGKDDDEDNGELTNEERLKYLLEEEKMKTRQAQSTQQLRNPPATMASRKVATVQAQVPQAMAPPETPEEVESAADQISKMIKQDGKVLSVHMIFSCQYCKFVFTTIHQNPEDFKFCPSCGK